MSTPLLVQALAALSAPALAGAGLLGARMRRAAAAAAEREAALQGTVAELRQERDELQRTASCDPLTGVWNYRHLQITLDKEIERARRAETADEKRPLALLMLEIAGFDAVVAEHGRSRAGAVLRDLAQRLAVEIRRSDTLGRYGGEEFLVLLPDTGAEGAVQVAERLCWTVRRHRLLDWSGSGPAARATRSADPDGAPATARGNGLTAAVGIAVLPRDGSHAALLLRAADRALAEARRAGGDCWRGAPVETVPAAAPAQVSAAPAVQPGRRPDGPTGAVEIPGSLSACAGSEATLTSVGQARTAAAAAATAAARDGV
ncbi:diguanylate cyclase (GGDEF)-like protein [Streptomyces sp. TLI_235]|nr:GGDEF domain-containing protein [Streptomyces sp. TLI_235]PBC78163.1 diguanylate cyclase (GGDEF)-like protein [Streptomyces sp. TLI_235]